MSGDTCSLCQARAETVDVPERDQNIWRTEEIESAGEKNVSGHLQFFTSSKRGKWLKVQQMKQDGD